MLAFAVIGVGALFLSSRVTNRILLTSAFISLAIVSACFLPLSLLILVLTQDAAVLKPVLLASLTGAGSIAALHRIRKLRRIVSNAPSASPPDDSDH